MFLDDCNLDESGSFLRVCSLWTDIRLHHNFVNCKTMKKVITILAFPKVSDRDFIPVEVLKNCEPELWKIMADLCTMCCNESLFPECWNILYVLPVFTSVMKITKAKIATLLSLVSVVIGFIEKLVNRRLVDHLEKCGLLRFLISFLFGRRSFDGCSWKNC